MSEDNLVTAESYAIASFQLAVSLQNALIEKGILSRMEVIRSIDNSLQLIEEPDAGSIVLLRDIVEGLRNPSAEIIKLKP